MIRIRTLFVFGLLVLCAAIATAAAEAPPVSGEVRVNGQPLALTQAYLLHAPDAFEEKQINAIVLLTPEPLDAAALRAADSLRAVFDLAPRRVVIEFAGTTSDGSLAICHPAFPEGFCYRTTSGEYSREEAAGGHLAGTVQTFTGEEETVLEKYLVFYDLRFDAAPARDLTRRR
ncbi:MAG TPA: hypothetical protein PKZ08_14865 [Vicinamibacterales bacterium]|nr:hypothetical protein [Vicinamibacterales bacterium]